MQYCMSGSLEGVVFGFSWKLWQHGRFQLRPHQSHIMRSCQSHRELKIHVRSRELICEKLEGCLHMDNVRLMLCLTMKIIMLQQQPQFVKKCVLQLVVVVLQFQLLIQVVTYVYSSCHTSTCSNFCSMPWLLSEHNLGTSIMMAQILHNYQKMQLQSQNALTLS